MQTGPSKMRKASNFFHALQGDGAPNRIFFLNSLLRGVQFIISDKVVPEVQSSFNVDDAWTDLDDGNDEEGEGEDRYPKEDGGQAHAHDVGDDEEEGGDQPGQEEPAGT